jgi:chorismate mutase/prephenate dehydratase
MENLNIAYLGPKATFCHEASLKYFNHKNNFIPVDKIEDVFKKVIHGDADYGVVPAENSIGGAITDTLDLFIQTDLKIYDEITIEIKQNLLSKTTKDKIKRIYTHPQSYYQCTRYIFENFPKAEYIETNSNSKAAILASKDDESASIGPKLCATEYNLNVLEENINDYKHNETKFFVISKNIYEKLRTKSMIIFSVPNKSGSLFNILKIIKKNRINMTRIESRPSKIKKWEYIFIVEFENSKDPIKNKKLLDKLEKACKFFDYLGSY